METKEDISYGIVPLCKNNDTWEVLLVHQISYRGKEDTFWTLPKGHAEAGEEALTTAKREFLEETGIHAVDIDEQKKFETSYRFVHEGVQINKTVVFWVGYCRDTKTLISQPHEIKEIRWCTLAAAQELLAHQNTKDVLTAVAASL